MPTLLAQVNTNQQCLTNQNSFSMILLGDPQNYVKYDYNQPVFELMTAWIASQIDNLKIKAVLCTGDLVDQNECIVPPFPRFGNISSKEQWTFVSNAYKRLDNKIPYIISLGNHDYGYTRSENSMTHYPDFFPIDRNNKWKKTIVAAINNRNGISSLENAAMEIIGEHWKPILIISLEFAPRDEVLEWAKNLVASDNYKDHIVIVLTHSYLSGYDGKRLGHDGYKITPANSGEEIWEKLIQCSSNIRMVLCGHYAVPNERFDYTTGYRVDKNVVGKEVYQMMFNCQAIGGGMSGNGGDGWLRILEFLPDGKTIHVRTYSPLFGFSPTTKSLAYRKEQFDDFILTIK